MSVKPQVPDHEWDSVCLSVVIPCFDEEESLPSLFESLLPVLEKATQGSWEVILVDDGSLDRTFDLILKKHGEDPRVRGVLLSRNFGHQPAIFAGLAYSSGSFVGIMDADLQDPPEVLAQCFEKVQHEGYNLVYGVRKNRKASPVLKAAYWTFYRLMRSLAEYSWPLDAGDFCVFDRKMLRLLMQLPEHIRVLRGLRSWVGLRQSCVHYDRPERCKGESKYDLFKLVNLALNAMVSFTSLPLRLASLIGMAMSGLTFLLCLLLLVNRFFPRFTLFGFYIGKNPGTTTTVILLLIVSSLGFLCLGILGEYLGLLLKEVKRRPLAIVRERVGVKKASIRGGLVVEALEPEVPHKTVQP